MRIDTNPILPSAPTRTDSAANTPHRAGSGGPRGAQLSEEEVAYFAELERMGPLVYGRGRVAAGTAPAPVLGQRIDIKA
jgi:hypothetical protein